MNTTLKKPDYKGFGEHLQEYSDKGLPIDRKQMVELAEKYNCPLPGTEEWIKEGLHKPICGEPLFKALVFFNGDWSVGISSYSFELEIPKPEDKEHREEVRKLIKDLYVQLDGEFVPHVIFSDEDF